MQTYKTYKRSCTNWKSFSEARKITVDTGLSYDQALRQCQQFNNNRTAKQIRKGTQMEFVRE